MTGTWALVKKGTVINTIVWDGKSPLDFGDGVTSVEYYEDNPVQIGYLYADGEFSAPVPAPLTEEEQAAVDAQLLAERAATKESLLSQASQKIVVWQTKLLMGRKLTADETASLNAWMDYIDELSAIDVTQDDIEWPKQPA